MTDKTITPDCEQIRLMSHALGISKAKTYHRQGQKYIKNYRNYYQTDLCNIKWEELYNNGYATKRIVENKWAYYYVSEKGMKYMEKHLGAIIKEQD